MTQILDQNGWEKFCTLWVCPEMANFYQDTDIFEGTMRCCFQVHHFLDNAAMGRWVNTHWTIGGWTFPQLAPTLWSQWRLFRSIFFPGTFTYRSPYISHMWDISIDHTHIWYIDVLDLFKHVDFNVGWFNARASPNLWVDCYINFEPHPYPNFQTTSNCAFVTISQKSQFDWCFSSYFPILTMVNGRMFLSFSFLWSLQQQYLYFRNFHQFMDRISRIFPNNPHFMIVLLFFFPWIPMKISHQ